MFKFTSPVASFLRPTSRLLGLFSVSRVLLDIGVCVEWNTRGFGYLCEEETRTTFWVPMSELVFRDKNEPNRSLAHGQRVAFSIVPATNPRMAAEGKMQAVRVTMPNGQPLPSGPRPNDANMRGVRTGRFGLASSLRNVTGAVVKWHRRSGCGSIKPDGGEAEIFVHCTSLVEHGVHSLTPGDRVVFDTKMAPSGKYAFAATGGAGAERNAQDEAEEEAARLKALRSARHQTYAVNVRIEARARNVKELVGGKGVVGTIVHASGGRAPCLVRANKLPSGEEAAFRPIVVDAASAAALQLRYGMTVRFDVIEQAPSGKRDRGGDDDGRPMPVAINVQIVPENNA